MAIVTNQAVACDKSLLTACRRFVLVQVTLKSRIGRFTSSWRGVPSPLADLAGVISHMPVSGHCDERMLR
jgi:hypothetical protein